MNLRRTVWSEARGPIPKGWVIHNLNGQPGDVRLENLAAVPRDSVFLAVAPYRERIRNLELQLKQAGESYATIW
mgnify:FL=1|jgi:hypothetical protein